MLKHKHRWVWTIYKSEEGLFGFKYGVGRWECRICGKPNA